MNDLSIEAPPITDKTFLVLMFSAVGDMFVSAYGVKGCQDLRRNALYTMMVEAIDNGIKQDLDLLEIMVSVVEQLKEDRRI